MRAHVDALFVTDPMGHLVRINEPGGQQAPRFFLGRTIEGSVWRVRQGTPDHLVRELKTIRLSEPLGEEFLEPPHGSERYESILAADAPIERKWAGPAYCFPSPLHGSGATTLITAGNSELLREHLEAWVGGVGMNDPVVVTVIDGSAVSVCSSVRKGNAADEAGVETAFQFRRRGHATAAVAAWATMVRAQGRVPLYSTSWTNTASIAVAHRLGLQRYGSTLHFA